MSDEELDVMVSWAAGAGIVVFVVGFIGIVIYNWRRDGKRKRR